MPYPTPTLQTLQQQAIQDIQAAQITNSAGQVIVGLLQMAVLRILAKVVAGFAYLLFDFQRYMGQQSTPFTATDEWATGWGALKGVTQKAPTAATGSVTFATSTNGRVLPSGWPVIRDDNTAFTTTSQGTVTGGSVTVTVQANIPGQAGTINVGDACSLGSPINGINGSAGLFSASATPGTDIEPFNDFRERYLAAFANPPQGGAAADYVRWATGAPGVTRAWILSNYNIETNTATNGVVSVLFMEDVVEAAHNGFPQGTTGTSPSDTRCTGSTGNYPAATGDQLALANYIFPLRPVTALVMAAAPTQNQVNFAISGENGPIPAAIQTLINAALAQMFVQVGSPGGTMRPDGGTGGSIFPSDWDEAISSVPGVPDYAVTSPSGVVTSSFGAMPFLGTVTYS